MMTDDFTGSFFEELLKLRPCPEEEFSACIWYQEMMELFEELQEVFSKAHHELLDKIVNTPLSSDVYEVVTRETPERKVNVSLLRERLPEVFSEVVKIRATDAERFIGRRRMYELSREVAGDRILSLEQVNLGDLAKVLPKGEFEEYVVTVMKPGRMVVVPKGEAV